MSRTLVKKKEITQYFYLLLLLFRTKCDYTSFPLSYSQTKFQLFFVQDNMMHKKTKLCSQYYCPILTVISNRE